MRVLTPFVATLLALTPALASARVVISEVMVHGAEFVELHNVGSDPVELRGYHLTGDVRFAFAHSTTLAPDGYLVLSVQGERSLREAYGDVTSAGELSGRPSRKGELRLFDHAGQLLDSLRYRAPATPNLSLQRIDPTSAYKGPLNWAPAQPSPGRENSAQGSLPVPAVDELSYPGGSLSPDQRGRISLRLFSPASEAVEVWADWRTRAKQGSVQLQPAGERGAGWSRLAASLPPFPNQSLVSFGLRVVKGGESKQLEDESVSREPLHFFVFDGRIDTSEFPLYCFELPPQEHTRLLERPERSRFPTSFVAIHRGGISAIQSGVKLQVRGGSWTRNWLKRAWVMTMPGSARYQGQRQLNLRSGWHDPTMLRDLMGFEAYRRAGVPSPRARWVRVHINGEFCGLFTEVEMIDARFLDRNGLSGGALYQARPPQRNSAKEKADGRAYETMAGYQVHWNKVTRPKQSYQDLRDFIEGYTSRSGEELEAYFRRELDVERYVSYLAVTVFISHWDSLIKNYYWVRDQEGTGKWTVIPWDLDRTWGDHFEGDGANSDPILLGTEARMIAGNRKWWNRLRDKFLSVPSFCDMLHNRIEALMRGPLESGRLINEMRRRTKAGHELLRLDRGAWGFYEREKRKEGDIYSKGAVSEAAFASGLEILERYTQMRSGYLRSSLRGYFASRPRSARLYAGTTVKTAAPEPEAESKDVQTPGDRDRSLLLWLSLALFGYVALGFARHRDFT